MIKIILSTGDKYVIETSSSEMVTDIKKGGWIFLEDDGRDIAIRAENIIAIEELTTPIIKEADEAAQSLLVCHVCGKKLANSNYHYDQEEKKRYCHSCWKKTYR